MELTNHDMVGIPIETFVPGLPINVDIYVSLSDDKFVLLFKGGTEAEGDRIKDLQSRGLYLLHVRKEDYTKFLERQVAIAGIAIKHTGVTGNSKVNFLSSAMDLLDKEFSTMGFSPASYEVSKSVAKAVIHLVGTEASLLRILEKLNSTSGAAINHSMAVALMSSMIGKAMGWTRPETLEKLALGGMLHDIGMQELPPALAEKSRIEMSYDELREYESHPFRGMQILQSIDIVPADVVAIAYEHHENSIGQGYPRRMWDMKLNPLARVVALANTFTDLSLSVELGHRKKSPQECLNHIEKILGQPFNKEAYRALKTLVSASRRTGSRAA